MTHLLGDPSKYFISEEREAQERNAFSLTSPLISDMILKHDKCLTSMKGNITATLGGTECVLHGLCS